MKIALREIVFLSIMAVSIVLFAVGCGAQQETNSGTITCTEWSE